MPNQNYIEAREELKMAQCDLSLSYPTCKTEERLCKFPYSAWCPTCDKDSPRRRSKSETNEPCRRKGKEMKGTLRKYNWNQECENMELEFEARDIRCDSSRVRSNLCELPTTYITNNCQMITKLSNCPSDFVDSTEKSIKCYENNLKSNDFNYGNQNFGNMMDKQERYSKLLPKIDDARNVNGIPLKIHSALKTHLNPLGTASVPNCFDAKRPSAKSCDLRKKPGTSPPLINPTPKYNETYITDLKNRLYDDFHNYNLNRGDCKGGQIKSPSPNLPKLPQNLNGNLTTDLKVYDGLNTPNIYYDTPMLFDKKVDVTNLRERYSREVEILQEKLQELKDCTYAAELKSSALIKRDTPIKFPPIDASDRINVDLRRVRPVGEGATGAVPKIPKTNEFPITPVVQSKQNRLKSSSKVSLKTKGKLGQAKLRKQQPQSQKIKLSSVAKSDSNSDDESDCSDSEDSDKEDGVPVNGVDSVDDVSVTSSVKKLVKKPAAFKLTQAGAADLSNWPVRQSLFANIPPYLTFLHHDVPVPQRLPTGNRHLKWKMSTITPILVRKTLVNSGFRLVRKSNEWVGTWGKHMKSPLFKTLKDSQKLNHFPGTFQIGRKDRLWRNLQRLMNKHGQKEFGFTPQTYVLPQDLKLLKQHWQNKNGNGNEKYIIKPPASARGTGIKVINRWSQLPKRMSLVVQEYISNPYLINGSKFDLRLYVLVTSFNPLRIYLYPDGLARFASVPYSDDAKDLKDRYMHLTNYSINKMSSQYTANEDANACKGHKWTISKLWEYMDKRGVDTKALWKNLQQLVIKTLISGESAIVPLCRENMNSRYNCYELFGVDVLLDEHLRCWLLEVNVSPSLHSQSPLDEYVKGPMVQALFELAQFHIPPRLRRDDVRFGSSCYDPTIYTTTLTKAEHNKHNYFSKSERRDYLEEILLDLTGDDVRHLTQAEDELTVIGNFERIFPTANTHKYLEFLDVRYYNRLFDAWENKYERNREPGIKILQLLCEQKLHLKIAPSTILSKSSQNLNLGESQSLQSSIKEEQQQQQPQKPQLPQSITVKPVAPELQSADVTQPNNTSIKLSPDVKTLYNALRLQSKAANGGLQPFSRTNTFPTHV